MARVRWHGGAKWCRLDRTDYFVGNSPTFSWRKSTAGSEHRSLTSFRCNALRFASTRFICGSTRPDSCHEGVQVVEGDYRPFVHSPLSRFVSPHLVPIHIESLPFVCKNMVDFSRPGDKNVSFQMANVGCAMPVKPLEHLIFEA